MDFYNHFFALHDHTYFCQIFVPEKNGGRVLTATAAVVMQQKHGVGLCQRIGCLQPKASRPWASACAAVGAGLRTGRRVRQSLSAGLPSRFVLISSGCFRLS